MSSDIRQALDLPPVDQVGFVVPDMEEALALYEPLFGPFQRMDAPVEGADFRGEKKDCNLQLAFGRSGDLEIELIAITEGDSPHREFLERGGNGMHHLRFRVGAAIDAKIEQARALGYECIWYKRMSEEIAFAYLERPGDPLIVELLQMPE